jgi:hypothetical protein
MNPDNSFPLDPPQLAALAAMVVTPELLQTENATDQAELVSPKIPTNRIIDYEDYSHHGLNE